ncbi:PH domain-containing protein [Amycolatopsis sp. FDAARGOS 1241]|uniref:PH domain-containing protein n=1 Tax=Amycolatopsis sp. FDAARGOS 1241 TaxID=2778070 RepID=UPI001951E3BD|nr:PH domain-containing protein [Amycolatopsis sp. FDAARGOS 1241]QRP44537.1 PH domain-containing protein [Amycolatopsis sp. FDAARGOS 1241]
MAEEKQDKRADEGRKAVFKIPNTAYMAIALLTVCVTPIALGEINGLQWLYIFPVALFVFVLRTRTVATRAGLEVRTVFGKRDLPWSALKGLAITDRARVRAVLGDDTQITLPTVRTRHLPVLSLVSEGKIKDPSGVLSEDDLKPGATEKTTEKTTAATAEQAAAKRTEETAEKDAPEPAGEAVEQAPDAAPAETGGDKAKPGE